MGLGDLHAQQPGKFALVKIGDKRVLKKTVASCLRSCWHEHSNPIQFPVVFKKSP
jgi:hypothetical protein